MAYAYLKLGASGEDVKTLQRLLSDNGYSTDVDGVFGERTERALMAYQSANRITPDGAAGEDTWLKLAMPAQARDAGYTPAHLSTQERVEYLESNRPPAYKSSYTEQIDALLNQVLNREAFEYDPASDEMYKRYRDQYTYMGEKAMHDAIGSASALSGGYANSYAVGAGNQAYQDYLARLSGEIPALYKLALGAYDAEGERMQAALTNLKDLSDAEYDAYTDDMDAYNDALDYYYKKLKDERALAAKASKSGGGSSKGKTEQHNKTQNPAPAASLANILSPFEYSLRKSAGAASLRDYNSYEDYVAAMKRKYSVN